MGREGNWAFFFSSFCPCAHSVHTWCTLGAHGPLVLGRTAAFHWLLVATLRALSHACTLRAHAHGPVPTRSHCVAPRTAPTYFKSGVAFQLGRDRSRFDVRDSSWLSRVRRAVGGIMQTRECRQEASKALARGKRGHGHADDACHGASGVRRLPRAPGLQCGPENPHAAAQETTG